MKQENKKFRSIRQALIAFMLVPFAGLAQFSPGLPAAFGIDGDVLSGQAQNISGPSSQGSFDWFRKTGNGPNVGYGIIDTVGTSMYSSQIATAQNISFTRGMAYSRYSAVNGYLLLDARYSRDNFGYSAANGQKDFTTFTGGSKNGDNPLSWNTTPNGSTVSDKADIVDTYIHMRRDGTVINNSNPSALILALGISTVGNTGSRYIDFELFKERIAYDPSSGNFGNSGLATYGGHSTWEFNSNGTVKELGDMEVSFSFGTAGVTDIAVYIWVPQSVYNSLTPAGFNFAPNEFYGAGVNAAYGYARITPKNSNLFRTWASNSSGNTQSPPWGSNSKANGSATNGYFSTQYAAHDFAEVAIDLTTLGIDPATSVGSNPCIPPFTRVMAKTRSSASFTSALQDFTGPYEFLDAPQVSAQIATPGVLKCNTTSVTLSPAASVAGAVYKWTTVNGNIVSNPNTNTVTVDKPGKYYLSAAIVEGCPANIDSTVVTSDYFKPVASAYTLGQLDPNNIFSTVGLQGGDVAASNFATPFGGSAGLNWKWTGPNGYTANTRNASVNTVGIYKLELTESRNGCKDTAITPVQNLLVLPLTLGEFTAAYKNGFTRMSWFTSAEYNTSYFEIERSSDGINFKPVGRVSANGNSNSRSDYGFSDILTPKGLSYYRLRSVDVDGTFTFSKVVAINSGAVGISLLLVYPNPFGHKVQVRIESEKADNIQIRLLNYAGVVIRSQAEKVQNGISDIEIKNVSNLGPGMYELQIIAKSKSFSTKIVKQ